MSCLFFLPKTQQITAESHFSSLFRTNPALRCIFVVSLLIIFMNWISLESAEQLSGIKQKEGYSIIFKHSTRCSISLMAKRRLELDGDHLPENLPVYFLDLIKYREISNLVAQDFQKARK